MPHYSLPVLLSQAGGLSLQTMPSGKAKWFDALGYGFIRPEDGGKDVLVHLFAVRREPVLPRWRTGSG